MHGYILLYYHKLYKKCSKLIALPMSLRSEIHFSTVNNARDFIRETFPAMLQAEDFCLKTDGISAGVFPLESTCAGVSVVAGVRLVLLRSVRHDEVLREGPHLVGTSHFVLQQRQLRHMEVLVQVCDLQTHDKGGSTRQFCHLENQKTSKNTVGM